MTTENELRIKTDALGRVLMGEVERITGWSRWTVRNKILLNLFPAPVDGLGRGESQKWCESDIRDWAISQPGYCIRKKS